MLDIHQLLGGIEAIIKVYTTPLDTPINSNQFKTTPIYETFNRPETKKTITITDILNRLNPFEIKDAGAFQVNENCAGDTPARSHESEQLNTLFLYLQEKRLINYKTAEEITKEYKNLTDTSLSPILKVYDSILKELYYKRKLKSEDIDYILKNSMVPVAGPQSPASYTDTQQQKPVYDLNKLNNSIWEKLEKNGYASKRAKK